MKSNLIVITIHQNKSIKHILTKDIAMIQRGLPGHTKDKETAYNIYIIVLLILIVLYLYFIKVNYQAYQDCSNENRCSYLIRLYGSIFFLLGGLCFLYYRIDNKNNLNNPVEI